MRWLALSARNRWLDAWGQRWHRVRRPLGLGLAATLALLLLYGVSPYATLWRLNQAVTRDDASALARLVDLDAVRAEIRQRLDKDHVSAIGPVSDAFVEWMDAGIRRHGADAPEALVTLDWVRDQLESVRSLGSWPWPGQVSGFFAGWRAFETRIERPRGSPLRLGLRLGRAGWRVAVLYH